MCNCPYCGNHFTIHGCIKLLYTHLQNAVLYLNKAGKKGKTESARKLALDYKIILEKKII